MKEFVVMKRTCGFICPTDDTLTTDSGLRSSIIEELKRLITQEHVTRFLSGMNLGGDLLCSEAVLQLKNSYPHILLESVFPYENQAEHWTEEQRDQYYEIASQCDKETLLQYHFDEKCLFLHKKYIADKSDIILTVNQTEGIDNLHQFKKEVIRITSDKYGCNYV